MVKILLFVMGILIAIISYFVKRAFEKLDEHSKQIEEFKLTCYKDWQSTKEDLIERISEMLDEKLEAWWNKIEINLMNEGRLPPKRVKQ